MGAPNYSPVQNPEAGRVYVYSNNAVSVKKGRSNGGGVYVWVGWRPEEFITPL